MITPRKFQVAQRVLLLGALLAGLVFAFLFEPLSHTAAALDDRLIFLWDQLNRAGVSAAPDTGVDLAELEARGHRLQGLATRLAAAGSHLTNQLALEAPTREKMRLPFQLVELQNERQLRIEKLGKLAQEKNVTIAPATFAGFPDYSSEQKQPGLLWAQLALVQYAVEAGIQCQLMSINNLTSSLPRPVNPEEASPAADELSITLEVTGNSPALTRFLLCLALRPEEGKALALPALGGNKPTLFLDRLLMRRNSVEKPDSIKMELRITAVVFRN